MELIKAEGDNYRGRTEELQTRTGWERTGGLKDANRRNMDKIKK